MKVNKQAKATHRTLTQSHLTTAAASSAITLALLTAAQSPVRAEVPQEPPSGLQNESPNTRAFEKFINFGYNYCDAKVLAAFWGESTPLKAKYRMGNKLLTSGPDAGEAQMSSARAWALKKPVPEMPVWYTDGGYTFDDAEALGKYWGGGLQASKFKMTRLLVQGKDEVIKASLRAAGR